MHKDRIYSAEAYKILPLRNARVRGFEQERNHCRR